jgi:hypothetical protein
MIESIEGQELFRRLGRAIVAAYEADHEGPYLAAIEELAFALRKLEETGAIPREGGEHAVLQRG